MQGFKDENEYMRWTLLQACSTALLDECVRAQSLLLYMAPIEGDHVYWQCIPSQAFAALRQKMSVCARRACCCTWRPLRVTMSTGSVSCRKLLQHCVSR